METKTRLDIDTTKIAEKFTSAYSFAQKVLDNQVLIDCEPYVPMRTGNLRNSGLRGTTEGTGKIVWNAPYAKSVYDATGRTFSQVKHEKATAKWFEHAKEVHKEEWATLAKKAFNKGLK